MIKKILVAITPVLMMSCSGSDVDATQSEEIVQTEIDTISVDTLAGPIEESEPARPDYDVSQLLNRIEKVYRFPFVCDSNFIDEAFTYTEEVNTDENYQGNLSVAEVIYLGFKKVQSLPTNSASYSISNVIEIDSLKIKNEYQNYLEHIDLGETANATANLIGQIDIEDNYYYIIWTTSYHTFEACPYGEGSYVWATYFYNDEPKEVVLIGEDSGGADAPYWGSTYVTSVITRSKITSTRVDESGGEDDENGDEIIDSKTEKYTIKVSPEGLSEN